MPLPLILGIGAGIAAAGGAGAGINGGIKMKQASTTLKKATQKREEAIARFEEKNISTTEIMDDLGKDEIEICSQFQNFALLFELIQNKPEFGDIIPNDVNIPKYDPEELKKISIGAGIIAGGLGGAAAGTAGGFAAAGLTTSAVMALGTASTGTAIASLSGAAATNATLAALGGGAIAAGGGGMALGSTMLGVSTAGVGILVGGIIFSVTGAKLSQKADQAYYQALETERKIEDIIDYLGDLDVNAKKFHKMLNTVWKLYQKSFKELEEIIVDKRKLNWKEYTKTEKLITQNCVLLVGLLFKMCKIQLVLKKTEEDGEERSFVNTTEISSCMEEVDVAIEKMCA